VRGVSVCDCVWDGVGVLCVYMSVRLCMWGLCRVCAWDCVVGLCVV